MLQGCKTSGDDDDDGGLKHERRYVQPFLFFNVFDLVNDEIRDFVFKV